MMRRATRTILLGLALSLTAGGLSHALAQEMVVVPTRMIYPGDTIAPEALENVPLRRKLRNPAAVVYRAQDLAGKVAKRTLLPGRLIPVGSVREAWLVERGSTVQVQFVHGPLEITVAGIPLEPGAEGDLIRLRNVDTGAIFTGTVMADGTVRITES